MDVFRKKTLINIKHIYNSNLERTEKICRKYKNKIITRENALLRINQFTDYLNGYLGLAEDLKIITREERCNIIEKYYGEVERMLKDETIKKENI